MCEGNVIKVKYHCFHPFKLEWIKVNVHQI